MTTTSKAIPFVKASAYGNDFLVIEEAHRQSDVAELSRRLCERHNGIGADGVEWLSSAKDADAAIRLFNANGSEAEISGNGTRCVAAYLCSQKRRPELTIVTAAGKKHCRLLSMEGHTYEFEIGMGAPVIDQDLAVRLKSGALRGMPVSMGNPHFVVFVDRFAENWQVKAAEVGRATEFPDGVNVEFVSVNDLNNIEVRIFERGVGETQSSGTGSCAAAVAAIASQRAKSPVSVRAAGGTQIVRWDQTASSGVLLQGTAQIIGRGEYFV